MTPTDKHYHAVQLYKDEASLAETVARFVGAGFQADQPGIVIATPSHTKMILSELERNGLDPTALLQADELVALDAKTILSTFMVGSMPDPLRFKSNLGDVIERLYLGRKPCSIRAYGEMVDLLWQDGNPDGAIKLEMLWNQLASAYDFELLCGYAFDHFYNEAGSRVVAVISLHSEIVA